MDKHSVISLVTITETQDSIGQIVKSETSRNVYCALQSVTRQEFYDAHKNGINGSLVAIMFRYDYNDEKIAVVDSKRYYVYRTYLTFDDNIELYLEERQGITYGN